LKLGDCSSEDSAGGAGAARSALGTDGASGADALGAELRTPRLAMTHTPTVAAIMRRRMNSMRQRGAKAPG